MTLTKISYSLLVSSPLWNNWASHLTAKNAPFMVSHCVVLSTVNVPASSTSFPPSHPGSLGRHGCSIWAWGGALEDMALTASIWRNHLAFTSCSLIVLTNHRNVWALPWPYPQYLGIRCLANSPLGSSQSKMNNSSTSVRLKRQSPFVCTNPFSFLEP